MENYLKEMLVTLTECGVKFVVAGGVAVVLQGVERMTLDLDIAIQINEPNLNRLIDAVSKLNLRPRVPIKLTDIGNPEFVQSMIKEKGALVFSLVEFDRPIRHLNIFLTPELSCERLDENADWVDLSGTRVRVASKQMLIEWKNGFNRHVLKTYLT